MTLKISVRQATVRGGDNLRLDDVSVDIHSGRVHAFIGANGSGKSTLLTVLAGELALDSGSIDIFRAEQPPCSWSDLTARNAARLRALLAQDTPVSFSYSVSDVVGWGRIAWRGSSEQHDDDAVIAEELAANDLNHLTHRRITELSGGERARVHLARVLAQRAPLLLLDEADATLDLAGRAHLDAAVRRRRSAGDAVVLISHDLQRVAALADEVTLLKNGHVLASGDPAQVMTPSLLSDAYGVAVDLRLDKPAVD